MFYLRYLCLFAYGGVQHIFVVFLFLFFFVLCTLLLYELVVNCTVKTAVNFTF